MKNLIFITMAGIAFNAGAQLSVLENGQTIIGNPSPTAMVDSAATLSIWNHNPLSSSSEEQGRISFGDGTKARIMGDNSTGDISLYTRKDFSLWSLEENEKVFGWVSTMRTFYHKYSLIAPSYMTLSDERFKTNIKSLSNSHDGLMYVNPVSYTLIDTPSSDSYSKVEKAVQSRALDNRTHYGFIAQEIQKLYPDLVAEDEEGMLAIDYTGFIPLLVEAYKDLSNKVKEQEEIIFEMGRGTKPYNMPATVNEIMDNKAILKQNRPNPFNTATTIECVIPETVSNAFLCIYDLQGQQVMRMDIAERGTVNSVIEASSMRPGMYIYSLIADGAEVDSKRMIITD